MKFEKINLGEYFDKIAKQHKNKIAIKFLNSKNISFEELNNKSNIIFNWMKKRKVRNNDRICILSNKNEFVFYLIISCLKIGAAYTVLDKDNPDKRNIRIIRTLKPKLIFSTIKYKGEISKITNFISLRFLNKILIGNNISFKNKKFKLDTSAYNMFTSGSTGEPKGVSITHHNVLNFIDWVKKEYKTSKKDVFSNLNGLHFDNSIFDIFGGLFNGSTLVSVNKEELIDPKKFFSLTKKFGITTWFSVPSLIIYFMNFGAMNKKNLIGYKRIIFGGEAFPKKILQKLFNQSKEYLKFFNVYGPTECTCICSSYKISKFDFSQNEMIKYAPLGKKMIEKFKYYILNKNKKCRPNQKGELVLCGENVGKGYFNNPAETRKKFVQNHFVKNKKDIVYMTGDIVYQNKNSKLIYFISRSDNQIKYMGHRIELDEIEKAINNIKYVKRGLVTFGKKNKLNEITGWINSDKKNEYDIKQKLSKILPNYMIPSKINFLRKIPINNNGKVDKLKISLDYYD